MNHEEIAERLRAGDGSRPPTPDEVHRLRARLGFENRPASSTGSFASNGVEARDERVADLPIAPIDQLGARRPRTLLVRAAAIAAMFGLVAILTTLIGRDADTELDVTQSPNEPAAADCTDSEENLLEALLLWGSVEAWAFNVPATPDLEALSFAVLEEDAATDADGADQRLADAEARRVRATTDLTGAGAASARQEMVEFILADRAEVTACRGLLASISP